MSSLYEWLVGDAGFAPHGYCLIWDDRIIHLHVGSDAAIAIAYFIIPFALLKVRRDRPDLLPAPVAGLFAAFILLCGITHVFGIVTMWQPIYALEGILKAATAAVSLVTAAFLLMNMRHVANMPSVVVMAKLNEELRAGIREKEKAESDRDRLINELEERVKARTARLEQLMLDHAALNEELQAEIEARDAMLANVSHDFKTPLNAIIGFSEMLEMKVHGNELEGRNLSYVRDIRDAGQRLSGLVRQIVEVQRLKSGAIELELSEFDLADIFRSIINELELDARRKGLNINLNVEGKLTMAGDRLLVWRLFENILSNAVKYTDQGRIEIQAKGDRDWISIQVVDTGRGIAADKLPKVFEMFQRGDRSDTAGGHGVGLAIVREITRRHNGTVWLDSAEGEGTTVTVGLPVRQPEMVAASVSEN
ncbi:sensor histidine kinase [Gimibacter soli]|uniref:histidine kinase n=1 Tax=Gimibacter soli TaxID=3024400 RepID=A0AAF0BLJ8_9PROT|nr:HAMP domain-containing sensor histidine kinase [Gimibacter soli]WCL53520.1 HAMP domain-containing sensor histidine kinase [Gimibacter soli]